MDTIIDRDSGGMSSALVAIVAIIAIVVVLGGALYAVGYFPMQNDSNTPINVDVNMPPQGSGN